MREDLLGSFPENLAPPTSKTWHAGDQHLDLLDGTANGTCCKCMQRLQPRISSSRIDANRERSSPCDRDQKYVVGDEIFDMENNGRRKTDPRKALRMAGSWGLGRGRSLWSTVALFWWISFSSLSTCTVLYLKLHYNILQHTSMILTGSFANVCNIVFNLRSLTCLGTTQIFPAGEHPAPQQLGCRENLRNLRLKKTWRSWSYIYIHTYIYIIMRLFTDLVMMMVWIS